MSLLIISNFISYMNHKKGPCVTFLFKMTMRILYLIKTTEIYINDWGVTCVALIGGGGLIDTLALHKKFRI